MRTAPTSTIAGCVALAGFAVAILAGLTAGNPAPQVLWRALLAMIACWPLGFAVGLIVRRLVHEQMEAHRAAHPLPTDGGEDTPGAGGSPGDGDEEVLVV